MKVDLQFFRRLPKAELHCHLDGSLRVSTVIDLAARQKIDLPTRDPQGLQQHLTMGDRAGTLEDYIARFQLPLKVLQIPEALERVAYELAEDAWEEGIRYLEVRYSPTLHTEHGMTEGETIRAVKRGLDRAVLRSSRARESSSCAGCRCRAPRSRGRRSQVLRCDC
ncbi:MAG: adenosine deaminase, partial [Candidatus Marinimicrobia bacterium]|nr:adenosine deaminase [Candidatus Neomarinimicrobiota bacterium]